MTPSGLCDLTNGRFMSLVTGGSSLNPSEVELIMAMLAEISY